MAGPEAIAAIGTDAAAPLALRLGGTAAPAAPPQAAPASFGQVLMAGLERVDAKVVSADGLVRQFAADSKSVPVHQVTMALADAEISVELAMQVRARLLEGYRELMNMPL